MFYAGEALGVLAAAAAKLQQLYMHAVCVGVCVERSMSLPCLCIASSAGSRRLHDCTRFLFKNLHEIFMVMQGWRTSMEDAHCAELDVDGQESAFFGVYDGVCWC